jgi:hypothetical protein
MTQFKRESLRSSVALNDFATDLPLHRSERVSLQGKNFFYKNVNGLNLPAALFL